MKKLVCAYIYGSKYHDWDLSHIDDVDVINYSFGLIKDNKLITEQLTHFEELKAHQTKDRKLVLSIGGWGADGFSQACMTEETRTTFISTILDCVKKEGLDGVDIDWEYPNSGAAEIAFSEKDPVNFTAFLLGLRKALDDFKPGLLLTIAVGAGYSCVENIEIAKIEPALNYLNIMTYDMNDKNEQGFVHHTNLYPSIPGKGISADQAIMAYHKAGMPLEKIIIGSATYGKCYSLDPNEKPQRGYPFHRIESEELETKFPVTWDEKACAPILHLSETMYVTYDNKKSVKLKCDYVKEKNLAGIMYWEYGNDLNGSLLKVMKENLNK